MPDALAVLKGLWVCSLALQAVLVYRIFESNLVFRLIWFASFLSAEVATGLILTWTPFTSNAYVEVWGVARPIICLLQLGVGWEAARRLLALPERRIPVQNYVLAGIGFAAVGGTGFLALRFEREFMHVDAWQHAIVLMGCICWALVALVLGIIQAIRHTPDADRNTVIHAWLLFALAATETLRYSVIAWSNGVLVSPANLGAVIAECILFLLWIVLLKEDAEAAALGQPLRA